MIEKIDLIEEIDLQDEEGTSLVEFIARLIRIQESAKDRYHRTYIEISCYGEDMADFQIYGVRPENDEEKVRRLEREAVKAKKEEARRREKEKKSFELYLKLREKYKDRRC
jgi:hypothetical protein